ncbi:unnamed protein product [Adineta steineri]|uniref:Reverse transcriptase domain-containing protein n=1 Tax=Adineta steineri TaxID=433720 RepID=A0A815MKU6_9BILA|nr:unnamed protein product [Adineta steineri]
MNYPLVNIDRYLGVNYDYDILYTYRYVKKLYRKHQSILLDIQFLKNSNDDLTSSSVYKNCQRRFLNLQIDIKYRDFRKAKQEYLASLDLLQNIIPDDLFKHLKEVIIYISLPLLQEKEYKMNQKLCSYVKRIKPKAPINRKIVTNLSSRVLSNEETECLANGLEFALVPRRLDDINVISNVEQFFHHITNIYHFHKPLMEELEEKNKAAARDIRLLTTQQMTLSSNLRSITDTFRHQAKRFRQQQYKLRPEQQQYRSLLKKLKEDPLIILTRPDKGRGAVLMNKDDYLLKMYEIINDSSKFQCLPKDPTISREQSLITFLNKLRDEKSITEQFHKMASPKGSNPGLLYGLPKVHKTNIPLRPVLSALGTYNYGLGKALAGILWDIIDKKTLVRDTFSFVKDLQALPKSFSYYKMVSFDISSLYTNIPLTETIKIILTNLYETRTTPPTIKRDDMEQLLIFATKRTHFLFDGQIYDQIDGVSMGSPLAPLLAEIFLQDFEKKNSSDFTRMGIMYYKRFVDDTFVLINSTTSPSDICHQLSQFHESIKFTYEEQSLAIIKREKFVRVLPFLDTLVQKQANIGFITKIYRKPTFTGLMTKWDSFVPKTHKYNAISSLVYRAIKICSTHKHIHEEFKFIRQLAANNGYPMNFVDSIIRRQLDLLYNPPEPKPPTQETETVVMRIPYFGPISQTYGKRLSQLVSQHYPLKQIRIVYDAKDRIGTGFSTKDKIPKLLKSGVVYKAECPRCNQSYIGKTYRHLKTRINEHLAEQRKSLPPTTNTTQPVLQQNQALTQPCTTVKTHRTRSKTGKLPKPLYDLTKDPLQGLVEDVVDADKKEETKIPKSSIEKHYRKTGHTFEPDDFKILTTEQHRYRLLVRESIHIARENPVLNNTDRSVPLYVYPDGVNPITTTTINPRIAPGSSHTQYTIFRTDASYPLVTAEVLQSQIVYDEARNGIDKNSSYTCDPTTTTKVCSSGWYEADCALYSSAYVQSINSSSALSFANGGFCRVFNNTNRPTCYCSLGFTDLNCPYLSTRTIYVNCFNGGVCTTAHDPCLHSSYFICTCASRYSKLYCNTNGVRIYLAGWYPANTHLIENISSYLDPKCPVLTDCLDGSC